MPNPENITNQTKEQLSANGRKGAAKSLEVKRQKKAMAEELRLILAMPMKRSVKGAATKLLSTDKAKALEDFNKKNTQVQTQILLKLTQMAMQGNIKAMALIMELSGETSKDVNVNVNAGSEMKGYYEELTYQLKNRHIEGVDEDD